MNTQEIRVKFTANLWNRRSLDNGQQYTITPKRMQCGHLNEMATELLDTESGKGDSLEEERNRGDETTSSADVGERTSYLQIPFGFQSKGSYKHASKNCEIVGGNYSLLRMRQEN